MPPLIDHPKVSHAEIVETAMRDGSMSNRLVVRTCLVLDPDQEHFDRAAYDGLLAAIQDLMTRRPDIDAADINGE
jgi:hypothetical protein